MTEKLLDVFERHFDIVFAINDNLRAIAHQVRYQSYALEHGFERPECFHDGQERDEYDDRSLHSLLRDRHTGQFVGTARIVLSEPDSKYSDLPIARAMNVNWPERQTSGNFRGAEISRFTLLKTHPFKHHEHLRATPSSECMYEYKQASSLLMLGLVRSLVQMSIEDDVRIWCAGMDPRLLRLLSRYGIRFVKVGKLVEYHGPRQPCIQDLATLLDRVRDEKYDIWEFLTAELAENRKSIFF